MSQTLTDLLKVENPSPQEILAVFADLGRNGSLLSSADIGPLVEGSSMTLDELGFAYDSLEQGMTRQIANEGNLLGALQYFRSMNYVAREMARYQQSAPDSNIRPGWSYLDGLKKCLVDTHRTADKLSLQRAILNFKGYAHWANQRLFADNTAFKPEASSGPVRPTNFFDVLQVDDKLEISLRELTLMEKLEAGTDYLHLETQEFAEAFVQMYAGRDANGLQELFGAFTKWEKTPSGMSGAERRKMGLYHFDRFAGIADLILSGLSADSAVELSQPDLIASMEAVREIGPGVMVMQYGVGPIKEFVRQVMHYTPRNEFLN